MNLDIAEPAKNDDMPGLDGAAAVESCALSAAEFDLSIVDDLDTAKEDWLAFEDKAAYTSFQGYQWMHAWQMAVRGIKRVSPLIVFGHYGGKLAFILPFAVEKRHGARRLIWFGHELADYNGPLFDPDILERLRHDFVADILQRVRVLVPTIDYACLAKQPETLCGRPNPFATFRSVPFTCGTHSAQLNGNWEEFSLAHRSARSLRRIREKEKNLARRGDLTFKAVTSVTESTRLMDMLVTWKIAQLTARGDRAPFANAAARRLMRHLAQATPNNPRLRLYALESAGEIIALGFCLIEHGRLIYYLCAYDGRPEMARYSPGMLLLVRILKAAIDEGLEVFDFSNGDEDYKSHWIDQSEEIFVSWQPFTLKGRIAVALDRMELETIRWVKRHPPLRALANRIFRLWSSLAQRLPGRNQAAELDPIEDS